MSYRLTTLSIFACILCSCKLFNSSYYSGPLKSYGIDSTTNSISDFVTVTIEPDNIEESDAAAGGIGIGDVVGPIASVALDVANNAISNRQAQYTASYSNSAVLTITKDVYNKLSYAATHNGKGEKYPENDKADMIVIRRYLINNNAYNYQNTSIDKTTSPIAAEFFFKVQKFDSNGIQLRLAKLNYLYAKARFKNRSEKKDFLSISIDMKLSSDVGSDQTPASPGSDTGKSHAASPGGTPTLGESIVLVPIIRPNKADAPLIINRQNKLVNNAYFKGISLPDAAAKGSTLKEPMISMSVTISEANISHIKPSSVDNFLKNNGADVTTLIKAFFPSASGSSGSKSGK